MKTENRYCCRCHKTTSFILRDDTHLQCTGCGVMSERATKSQERALIGDPFRSYKTSFAA